MPPYKIHPDGRRLGRKIKPLAERDKRAFKLTRYLVPSELSPPPESIDHSTMVTYWPMNANDRLGDCGPAGAAHQLQSWSVYAGRPELRPTEQQVVDFYFAITGGQDTGVYLEDMFARWKNVGLAGDKIEAYVETDAGDLNQFKLAIQLFGSAGIGLSLPDKNTFGPWDSPDPLKDYGSPNPQNGHYVCAVAYNDAIQQAVLISWGEVYVCSYAFLEAYNDQTVVALNDLELSPTTGQSPEAFDFYTLMGDLDELANQPPAPQPEPPPAPGPGCLGALAMLAVGIVLAILVA